MDIEYPKQLWNKHKDLPFLPNREKVNEIEKLVKHRRQEEICDTHKHPHASIKSWVRFKKGTQGNYILAGSMVKAVY